MPSSENYVRDYEQERKTAKARGETGLGSNSGDAQRHRARRMVEKKLGRKLAKTQHVDHKKPLNKGGKTAPKNLRVLPASENMSMGGKGGNKAGKAAGAKKANKSK